MGDIVSCTHSARRAIIVVEENHRVAAFLNSEKAAFSLTKFDKCVATTGKSADFILTHPDSRRVIIELKGKNVEEAEDQIIDTMVHLTNCGIRSTAISALIICPRSPLASTGILRLAGRLKKHGIVKLKVKSREWKGEFENLF